MLHACLLWIRSMSWDVYVNVTCLFWIEINVWKCLFECYMLVVNKINIWKCLFECYVLVVKINVSQCVCECYMLVVNNLQGMEMFIWMLHACCELRSMSGNVYVNVTQGFERNIVEQFEWE
jgi:hypothetical protein